MNSLNPKKRKSVAVNRVVVNNTKESTIEGLPV